MVSFFIFNELFFANLADGSAWKLSTEHNLPGTFKRCHSLFTKPDEAIRT
jgi:hypothetical protein